MAPDECPDWTVVDVGSGCILIKRDGVWWYSDSEGGPARDSVELWYEHGPWEIKALPAKVTAHKFDLEDDEPLIPRRVGHEDNEPVNSRNVLSGYANLMMSINDVNRSLPEEDRFMVPFGVQEAIVAYVEERQAIESIWNQQQEDNA